MSKTSKSIESKQRFGEGKVGVDDRRAGQDGSRFDRSRIDDDKVDSGKVGDDEFEKKA